MSIYDFLAITATGAIGFVLGVVTTIKVDDTHERIKRKLDILERRFITRIGTSIRLRNVTSSFSSSRIAERSSRYIQVTR